MKLAECRARELAHRDEVGPRNWGLGACPRWDTVCPRSGPATHHPKRPTTSANIPELRETA
jgi:hypothetical protein